MIPQELPSIPGGWTERTFECGKHQIQLTLPQSPDDMLETEEALAANEQNNYTPYWSYLWPAAIEMLKVIPTLPIPDGADVLEIGCGIGLVGIAAAVCGHKVTLSDYAADAVQLAAYNAARNGIELFSARRIDWTQPPPADFDVVLACDVLYEQRDHEPLLQFLEQIIAGDGVAWIGDPGRQRALEFIGLAQARCRVDIFDASLNRMTSTPRGLSVLRLSKH